MRLSLATTNAKWKAMPLSRRFNLIAFTIVVALLVGHIGYELANPKYDYEPLSRAGDLYGPPVYIDNPPAPLTTSKQ